MLFGLLTVLRFYDRKLHSGRRDAEVVFREGAKPQKARITVSTESLSGYKKVVLDVHVGRFPDSRVRYIDT